MACIRVMQEQLARGLGKGKNKIITRLNFTGLMLGISFAGVSMLRNFHNYVLHHKTICDRKQHNIEYKKKGIKNTKIVHHQGQHGNLYCSTIKE